MGSSVLAISSSSGSSDPASWLAPRSCPSFGLPLSVTELSLVLYHQQKTPYIVTMDHDSHFQARVDAERMRVRTDANLSLTRLTSASCSFAPSQMSSFTFGKPISPAGASPPPPRHSRSHSRNGSVSMSLSLPSTISHFEIRSRWANSSSSLSVTLHLTLLLTLACRVF